MSSCQSGWHKPKGEWNYGGIAALNYLQTYSLSNQTTENFIGGVLTKTVTEIGGSAVGRGLREIEATEKTQPGIVAKG